MRDFAKDSSTGRTSFNLVDPPVNNVQDFLEFTRELRSSSDIRVLLARDIADFTILFRLSSDPESKRMLIAIDAKIACS